jgi:hypothetical protein
MVEGGGRGEERCGGHPICAIGCPRGVNGMWIRCVRDQPKDKGRPVKGVLPFRPGGEKIPFSKATIVAAEAEVGKSSISSELLPLLKVDVLGSPPTFPRCLPLFMYRSISLNLRAVVLRLLSSFIHLRIQSHRVSSSLVT